MIPKTIRTDEPVYKVETKEGYSLCNEKHLKDKNYQTIYILTDLGFRLVDAQITIIKNKQGSKVWVLDSYSYSKQDNVVYFNYTHKRNKKQVEIKFHKVEVLLKDNEYTLQELLDHRIPFYKLEKLLKGWN